jgi:hypothetical protein
MVSRHNENGSNGRAGRAKNSARPRYGSILVDSAPVLSRGAWMIPSPNPEKDTVYRPELDDFSHAIGSSSNLSLGGNCVAQNMLYLKRVFLMKYAQFHALYGALKERVGSVKKAENALSSQSEQPF